MSVMASVPLRVPTTVGLKVTLIMQLDPAATLAPQVFVCAKSPLIAMLEMDSAPLPELVSVTVCALEVVLTSWLAKARLEVESDSLGAVAMPERGMDCDPAMVLSINVRVPCVGPGVVGAKVTSMVHSPPRTTLLSQLLVA